MLGWSNPHCSPIALDFGADSLKALQIMPASSADESPQLVAAASAVVPEDARSDPAARQTFYADALRDLLKHHHFRGKRAVCCIPAYQTLIQQFELARGDADREEQVAIHLRQRLNIDPARMVIRTFPAVWRDDETGKQDAICVAASRESVMRHLGLARRAGLDVVGMYCEPEAILAAFAHLYRRADDHNRLTCFLDIGAATSTVVVARGGRMVYAKVIHAAGDHFTRHHARTHELGFREAREIRWRDVTATDVPTSRDREGADHLPTARVLATAVSPVADVPGSDGAMTATLTVPADPVTDTGDSLECLIDELQLSLRQLGPRCGGNLIEKIVFLGGESRHRWLCQAIARDLRIAAQLGDPLARLARRNHRGGDDLDLRQPQPGWAVPMGLCLCPAAF